MCQCEDLTACMKSFLSNRVDSLYDNELDSDVVFLVGIEPDVWRIPGHKHILSNANPVFRALLEGPLATKENTIVIDDVESRAFDYILRYLYGKDICFQSLATALSTLYAAHKYLCSGLIALCVKYLIDNLTPRNVLEIFTHARLYAVKKNLNGFEPSAPVISSDTNDLLTPTHYCPIVLNLNNNNISSESLQENDIQYVEITSIPYCSESLLLSCLRYIDENAELVLCQEGIEDMSADNLKEIIQRDTLQIHSEFLVFLALDRWTNRECKRRKLNLTAKNRRRVLGSLLYEIRFPFFTPSEFISEPIRSGLLTHQELAFFSALISKSKNVPSIPHKWKCHMEKISRRRIYNENDIPSPSQKIYLIECDKHKNVRHNFFIFKKVKKSKKKHSNDASSKPCKNCADEKEKSCTKCFPDCLIDLLVCLFD